MIEANLKKPLLLAHAGGLGHGRENSIEAVKDCMQYKPGILELDLRKSRDGVIFCYHGFPEFPFFFLAYFLRFLKFETIRKFVKVDRFEDILKVIKYKTVVFMDLKDQNIEAEEFRKIRGEFPKFNYWLAAYDFDYLAKLKKNLGEDYGYVFNWSFFNFRKGLRRTIDSGLDAIKIYPWQCKEENIELLDEAKILYAIQPMFTEEKKFRKLVKNFGSLWLAVNDMRKPDELFLKR